MQQSGPQQLSRGSKNETSNLVPLKNKESVGLQAHSSWTLVLTSTWILPPMVSRHNSLLIQLERGFVQRNFFVLL